MQARYFHRALFSGNYETGEVDEIEKFLRRNNIHFYFVRPNGEQGGIIFRIPEDQLEKLPIDPASKEHYLPCSNGSGFSLYLSKLNERDYEGKWIEVNCGGN